MNTFKIDVFISIRPITRSIVFPRGTSLKAAGIKL